MKFVAICDYAYNTVKNFFEDEKDAFLHKGELRQKGMLNFRVYKLVKYRVSVVNDAISVSYEVDLGSVVYL